MSNQPIIPDGENEIITIEELHKRIITIAHSKYKGSPMLMSKATGIPKRTLRRKMEKYNLPNFRKIAPRIKKKEFYNQLN